MRKRHHKILLVLAVFQLPANGTKDKYSAGCNQQEKKSNAFTNVFALFFFFSNELYRASSD